MSSPKNVKVTEGWANTEQCSKILKDSVGIFGADPNYNGFINEKEMEGLKTKVDNLIKKRAKSEGADDKTTLDSLQLDSLLKSLDDETLNSLDEFRAKLDNIEEYCEKANLYGIEYWKGIDTNGDGKPEFENGRNIAINRDDRYGLSDARKFAIEAKINSGNFSNKVTTTAELHDYFLKLKDYFPKDEGDKSIWADEGLRFISAMLAVGISTSNESFVKKVLGTNDISELMKLFQ